MSFLKSEKVFSLALSLFVALILRANAHNFAFTSNDLAVFAHRLNRRSYFHNLIPPINFLRGVLVFATPNDSSLC